MIDLATIDQWSTLAFWARNTKKVALRLSAAFGADQIELREILDTFCSGFKPETCCAQDNGTKKGQ